MAALATELGLRANPDHVRTRPRGRLNIEGGRTCVCVMCETQKQRGKCYIEKQITQLHLCVLESGGVDQFHRHQQINRGICFLFPGYDDIMPTHQDTNIHTVAQSKYQYLDIYTASLPVQCLLY